MQKTQEVKTSSVFDCNISALKFSDRERAFLRIIFLQTGKKPPFVTPLLRSNQLANTLEINTNHLKNIVRRCEQKGGLRVIASRPGKYDAGRRYELSEKLYEALKKHYLDRQRYGRALV